MLINVWLSLNHTSLYQAHIQWSSHTMTDRMHQLIEGLIGIEVIADDFLVCGSGKSAKEALASHDKDLHSFLEYARDWGLKLNIEKVKLPLMSVPFMGHLLTDKGLSPDLESSRYYKYANTTWQQVATRAFRCDTILV